MDLEQPRSFVYHEQEAPQGKMVLLEDAQSWIDKGWVDTPAKFGEKPVEKKKEIDPFEIDDASDLSDYLNDKYGMKTNFRMGLKSLKKILKGRA